MAATNVLATNTQTTEEFAKTAYERLLSRIMSAEPVPSTNMNIDIMHAVITTAGCMPQLLTLRDALAKLGDFNIADLDDLDDAARALQHANANWLQTGQQPSALKELVERAKELVEILYTDATALVRRGLIHADALKDVKRANGYRALIQDLHVLLVIFRGAWESVQGRTAVQLDELNAAEALVHTLTNVVGVKEQSPAVQAEAALIRRKAFTVFITLYEEVRNAVHYVRRKEGDGSSFVPSLYPSRAGARQADKPEPSEPTGDGLHTAPAPSAALPAVTSLVDTAVTSNGPFKREQ